jgi:hypothetical protein
MIKTEYFAKFDKSWIFLEDYTEYQVRTIFGSSNEDFYENEECYAVRIYNQEESELIGYDPITMQCGIYNNPSYDSANNIAIRTINVVPRE